MTELCPPEDPSGFNSLTRSTVAAMQMETGAIMPVTSSPEAEKC